MNIVICAFMFFVVSVSSVWAERIVPAEDEGVITIIADEEEPEKPVSKTEEDVIVIEPSSNKVPGKFGRLTKEEEDNLARDITRKQIFRSDVAANISQTKKLLGLLEKIEDKLESRPVEEMYRPKLTASAKTYNYAPTQRSVDGRNVALIMNREEKAIILYEEKGGKKEKLAKILPGHVHTHTYDGFQHTVLMYKVGMFGKLSPVADFKGGTLVGICQNGGIVKTNDMSVLPPR